MLKDWQRFHDHNDNFFLNNCVLNLTFGLWLTCIRIAIHRLAKMAFYDVILPALCLLFLEQERVKATFADLFSSAVGFVNYSVN